MRYNVMKEISMHNTTTDNEFFVCSTLMHLYIHHGDSPLVPPVLDYKNLRSTSLILFFRYMNRKKNEDL